jgi:hypothetical protein
MTRPKTSFRKSDVKRAIQAAIAAQIPNPRVVIDTAKRTITIQSATDDQHPTTNEWDEVCDDTPETGEGSR